MLPCCGAPPRRRGPGRTGRCWPRCGRGCGASPGRWTAPGRCGRTWRCCCRSSASPPRRVTGRRCSRPCAPGSSCSAPAVVLLDDLQWSDEATLELLAALAAPLRELPMLVVGAYRSDEVGRGHPLRRLRADLRRARLLRELTVAPLDAAASAALAEQELGGPLSPALAAALFDRTQGVPVLRPGAGLRAGRGRPRARRPARASSSPTTATCPCRRRSATPCCCAPPGCPPRAAPPPRPPRSPGSEFALDLAPGLDELLETGLIAETEDGRATFRHALVRGAIYEDIQWRRRRELHWSHAERLTATGAPEHRDRRALARRRGAPARRRRLPVRRAGAASPCTRTATPPPRRCRRSTSGPRACAPTERLGALQLYAYSAEIAGDLAEAVRALREVAAGRGRRPRSARPSGGSPGSTSCRATASGR